ncbi:MAG: DUF7487 domain-containing protein [bacterium]
MLITETVNIKIINHNIQHYKSLNYNVNYGDVINVPVQHLTLGSHYKIDVMCDECHILKNIKYQDYIKITNNHKNNYYCNKCVKSKKTINTILEKYGVDNISKSELIKQKKENTNLLNWGVKNVFSSNKIISKIRKTCKNKYGDEYPNRTKKQLEKIKKTRIINGFQIPDDKINKYLLYRKNVLKITYKYKRELFDNWNGYDYYDSEYIKENLFLHSNNKDYPSIDHKISIYYGFVNNISYEEIGNIDNLCITKRKINSSKGRKIKWELKK